MILSDEDLKMLQRALAALANREESFLKHMEMSGTPYTVEERAEQRKELRAIDLLWKNIIKEEKQREKIRDDYYESM